MEEEHVPGFSWNKLGHNVGWRFEGRGEFFFNGGQGKGL